MQKDLYKRLARAEAAAASARAETMELLQRAYENACQEQNEEEAAAVARKIRNKLLELSDKEMSLDRLGLDTTTATKFIASLAKIFSGEWAIYRQALRDLTEQAGFPFNITFPTAPDAEETEEP